MCCVNSRLKIVACQLPAKTTFWFVIPLSKEEPKNTDGIINPIFAIYKSHIRDLYIARLRFINRICYDISHTCDLQIAHFRLIY